MAAKSRKTEWESALSLKSRYELQYILDHPEGYTPEFLKMAKATALIQGRTYVTPEDVKQVSHQVLRHRIGLNYSAVADNVPVEAVIDALVNSVKAP
jgi:hypothetical protein